MPGSNLIPVCGIAFLAVFILLAILAVAMYVITAIFPERKAAVDAAVVAAISGAITSMFPGSRVTSIQEEKS